MLIRHRSEVIAGPDPLDERGTFATLFYSTDAAEMLAGDDWPERDEERGRTVYERNGRNRWLFRTPAGRYFLLDQGPRSLATDRIVPLTKADAMRLWTDLRQRRVTFEDAFPGVEVRDA